MTGPLISCIPPAEVPFFFFIFLLSRHKPQIPPKSVCPSKHTKQKDRIIAQKATVVYAF